MRRRDFLGRHGDKLFIVLGVLSMMSVGVLIGPHFVQTLSPEHRRELDLLPQRAPMMRLHRLNAVEVSQLVRNALADTVIVHLWNSWQSNGTALFDSLRHSENLRFAHAKIIHLCTDMNGIRQRRNSGLLAQRYGIAGTAYTLRARASLFDLHNQDALRKFMVSLQLDSLCNKTPLLLFFNNKAQLISWKGVS